jgi:hypothetical protein
MQERHLSPTFTLQMDRRISTRDTRVGDFNFYNQIVLSKKVFRATKAWLISFKILVLHIFVF